MPLPPPELLASPWQPCEQCGAMVLADTGTRCPRCGFRPRRSGLIVNAGGFPPVFGVVQAASGAADGVDRVLIPHLTSFPGDWFGAIIAISPAGFQALGIFVDAVPLLLIGGVQPSDALYDMGLFLGRDTVGHGDVTAVCDSDIQGSYNIAACAFVLRGMRTTGNADKDLRSTATGTGTTADSGTFGPTAQAKEVLLGCVLTEGPASDDPGSWSNLSDLTRAGNSTATISLGWRALNAVGSYNAVKSGFTSRNWMALAVSLPGAV